MNWIYAAAAVLGLFTLTGNKRRRKRRPVSVPAPTNEKHAQLRALLELAFPGDWDRIAYYEVTAGRETGGSFDETLGRGSLDALWPPGTRVPYPDPSDTEAARTAFERNLGTYGDCPWGEARYAPGSLGVFQMFPANALYSLRKTEARCADPWLTAETPAAIAFTRDYESRLTNRDAYKKSPIWLTLAVGHGNPSKMGDAKARARVRENLKKWSRELGWGTSWINRRPQALPDESTVDLARRLGSAI